MKHEMLCHKLNESEFKTKLHDRTIKKYKKTLLVIDIIAALCIVFNLGALFTTNLLVARDRTDVRFYEVNPVSAAAHDFEMHKDTPTLDKKINLPKTNIISIITSFINYDLFFMVGKWVFISFLYLFRRLRLYFRDDITELITITIIFFIIISLDLINNLGYVVGTLV